MTTGSDGNTRRAGGGTARRLRLGLLAGCLAALNGCAYLPIGGELPDGQPPRNETATEEMKPPASIRGRQVAALLDYYRGVDMAPRAVLEERRGHLTNQLKEGECNHWRLKYAMVAKALAPPEDIPQSLEVLAVCLTDETRTNGALSEFAYLLEELWEAEAVSVQYRDQLQQTRRALENERGETAKLRKQLEGLKAIEQSIQQRDRDKGASGSE